MKSVVFQFTRFKAKLPPIGKPLLIIDALGHLWYGMYFGKGRIYDHIRAKATDRKGYALNIRSIKTDAVVHEVSDPVMYCYWSLVPEGV